MLVEGRTSRGEEKQGTLWKGKGDEGQLAQGAERRPFWGRTKLFYKDRGTDHLKEGKVDPWVARDTEALMKMSLVSFQSALSCRSLTADSPSQYCLLRHLHMEEVNSSA